MRPIAERNATVGFLTLRLFFAQFWLLQMLGKARDQESGIISLGNLSIWAHNVSDWMVKTTPLPGWAVRPYTTVLPFVECALGLLFLIGLQTRRALIASALLIVSLDLGLMLQLKHDVVAANTIILLAALLGLSWEPANRWSLDGLLAREDERATEPAARRAA
jgi:thiosulfate dehydrogenase [quinone] large subunit